MKTAAIPFAVALSVGLGAAAHAASKAQEAIANWPAKPKEVATKMIAQYGEPDGVLSDRLVWGPRGPWKETIVHRQEIPHDFPKPHTDLLEQVIAFRVPPDKFDDLAQYDGSVIAERTKGTLAARCDKEEMNFLALNLSKDVIDGRKSVAEARKAYADTVTAFMKGEKPAYTAKLQFEPARAAAGDRDAPAPGMASTK